MNLIFDKKIILVGHVSESYGPMQALPKYLAKNVHEFAVISHPFSYSGIPTAICTEFRNGKTKKIFSGPKYKPGYLVNFLIDFFLTFYFILRLGRKWDFYIGSDCLNAFSGIILRSIGVTKKVIFYEYDYTPARFQNKILNRIFHWLNGFAAKYSDMIWDNPPKLEKIRTRQGADLKKVLRVPHAVDLDKVRIPALDKINRQTLVYAGHVTRSKGLGLIVEALKRVVKIIPNIRISILGSGPYEPILKQLVKKNRMEKYFKFFGYTDHDWVLSYLPSCGVALAPYLPEEGGTFQYSEPLKVKDYLGCGLPIIITRVPLIAQEIEARKLGIAIDYDEKALGEAIVKLLTNDEFYQICRKNVLKYAANITWDYTYDQTFDKTFKIIEDRKRNPWLAENPHSIQSG